VVGQSKKIKGLLPPETIFGFFLVLALCKTCL